MKSTPRSSARAQHAARLGRILRLAPDLGPGDAHRTEAHAVDAQVLADDEACPEAAAATEPEARSACHGAMSVVTPAMPPREYLPACQLRGLHRDRCYNRARTNTMKEVRPVTVARVQVLPGSCRCSPGRRHRAPSPNVQELVQVADRELLDGEASAVERLARAGTARPCPRARAARTACAPVRSAAPTRAASRCCPARSRVRCGRRRSVVCHHSATRRVVAHRDSTAAHAHVWLELLGTREPPEAALQRELAARVVGQRAANTNRAGASRCCSGSGRARGR